MCFLACEGLVYAFAHGSAAGKTGGGIARAGRATGIRSISSLVVSIKIYQVTVQGGVAHKRKEGRAGAGRAIGIHSISRLAVSVKIDEFYFQGRCCT